MAPNRTTTEVRAALVDALRIDLVGPTNEHAFARELLPRPPSVWYLTGFLTPSGAPPKIRQDASQDSEDELDSPGEAGGTDDGATPEQAPKRKGLLPASIGLSVLVPAGTKELEAQVSWGDYEFEADGKGEAPPEELEHPTQSAEDSDDAGGPVQDAREAGRKGVRGYRRRPRAERVTVTLPKPGEKPAEVPVPRSDGLTLVVTARSVGNKLLRLPPGTQSVSVFVVNNRTPRKRHAIPTFAFQVELTLECGKGFIARVDPRFAASDGEVPEPDDRLADLHYRDVKEYAVGHGVAAEATLLEGQCRRVRTDWIPCGEVERVVPGEVPGVVRSMERLGALPDEGAARAALIPLVESYRKWITEQRASLGGLEPSRKKTAEDQLGLAEWAAERMESGIQVLRDPLVLEAFRIANRAMARQSRRRQLILRQREISEAQAKEPEWYPFQLAFLLTVLPGLADPRHQDRRCVDLLFFPTGGGKTEAYLGLAAFAMVLRRLRDPGPGSAGVCVMMRYTLRLLTLDQLGRATALVCALELEREKQAAKLGSWPFEIGLWVGRAATPNRMGETNDGDEHSARSRTLRFQRDSGRNGAPIPIEDCPWCGTKFEPASFELVPNQKAPTNLRVHCRSLDCEFNGECRLPIVAVDEPLYRRLPAFLIATVDKFAALPWTGHVGALFGRVDRHDREGFYGPCDPGRGQPLGKSLLPPDLVIQDELHLISGPLGTIAGVYETAIDALCERTVEGEVVRPKIVASTATVRRAEKQIRALFARGEVVIFPPPGPDRRDSFFAKSMDPGDIPARLYVGVAAQGRSLKVVFLRTALALLSVAQREWLAAGGDKNRDNPADPYQTLLGYFNSLRELGGSRRIVEDEIWSQIQNYSTRRRLEPGDETFCDREIDRDLLELTSRVPTNEVAETKRRLAAPFHEEDRVDVALATNMISVGLDIQRLGLMLVLGQPKTSAEYIQATSRVGRAIEKPGLVVTLLNIHKPRDRSHYERFRNYHDSFYRSVEATSVTPFSPRALDRALAATLVGLCRHGEAALTPPKGALAVRSQRARLEAWAERIAQRVRDHSHEDPVELERVAEHVRARARSLLDDWLGIARRSASEMQYGTEVDGVSQRLLHDFLDPDLETSLDQVFGHFRAARSMRDVEASADLQVKYLRRMGS